MKCKNCGGEIRLEDMYCPYCGRLLLIEKGLEPYMAEQAGESQTSD